MTFERLKSYTLNPKLIREYEPKWLIDDLLHDESLNCIYVKASAGKSFFALYLSIWLLKSGKVKKVIYFDGDNGKMTYKRRKIDDFVEQYKNLLYISTELKPDKEIEYIDKKKVLFDLASDEVDLSGTLIVIDSARDFMGADMNKDDKVIPFFRSA